MAEDVSPEALDKAARLLIANVRELLRQETPDKLTLGTPSKGGELVVYFNADKPADANQRVDNALLVLQHGRTGHASLTPGA